MINVPAVCDRSGEFQWAKTISGSRDEEGYGISATDNGVIDTLNVYYFDDNNKSLINSTSDKKYIIIYNTEVYILPYYTIQTTYIFCNINKLTILSGIQIYGILHNTGIINNLANTGFGSMSLFAGYLCDGLVLIDKKSYIWRKNIFNYSENIFKVFDNFSDEIDLIRYYL